MNVNIEIYKGDDEIFIAMCPELELYYHADTKEEAIEGLKEDIFKYVRHADSIIDVREDINPTVHYYSTRFPQVH